MALANATSISAIKYCMICATHLIGNGSFDVSPKFPAPRTKRAALGLSCRFCDMLIRDHKASI